MYRWGKGIVPDSSQRFKAVFTQRVHLTAGGARRRDLPHPPVLAHNASLDMSVVRYGLDHLVLRCPDLEYYCTLVLSRACRPGLNCHRLPDVASHCGGGPAVRADVNLQVADYRAWAESCLVHAG